MCKLEVNRGKFPFESLKQKAAVVRGSRLARFFCSQKWEGRIMKRRLTVFWWQLHSTSLVHVFKHLHLPQAARKRSRATELSYLASRAAYVFTHRINSVGSFMPPIAVEILTSTLDVLFGKCCKRSAFCPLLQACICRFEAIRLVWIG